MMSRMSLTGHVFIGLGDAIVGLLLGLGALSVTGGTVLPLIQALLGKSSRKVAGLLLLVGLLVAGGSSVMQVFPYSGWCLDGVCWACCLCANVSSAVSATKTT